MPKERCEEQSNLALTAVAAINRVYDAKNELDAARKRKLDIEPYLLALCDAQTAVWCAVADLTKSVGDITKLGNGPNLANTRPNLLLDANIWQRFEAMCAECDTSPSAQVQVLIHAWTDQQETSPILSDS